MGLKTITMVLVVLGSLDFIFKLAIQIHLKYLNRKLLIRLKKENKNDMDHFYS
jgi:hypothetical protein